MAFHMSHITESVMIDANVLLVARVLGKAPYFTYLHSKLILVFLGEFCNHNIFL